MGPSPLVAVLYCDGNTMSPKRIRKNCQAPSRWTGYDENTEVTSVKHLKFINCQSDIRSLHAENAARHRQTLFTDAERQGMSEELVCSVPDHDPDQVLLDLDKAEADILPPSLFRGPFGVLRLSELDHVAPAYPELEELQLSTENWLPEEDQLPGIDETSSDHVPFTTQEPDTALDEDGDWAIDPKIMTLRQPTPLRELLPFSFSEHIEAWTLLSHYKNCIIRLISPLRHGQETPWATLVVPCAVGTLGELSMNGTVNHARLALLYALLSTSAFHLEKGSASLCGEMYLVRAQAHLERCMDEMATSVNKNSKYKNLLMAILSISNAFMVKGDPVQRLVYLHHSERFIYANGFKRPFLSAKRRALHHCYAYMRIMAETTCISDDTNDTSLTSTMTPHDLPRRYFRVCPNITFSENTLSIEKDPETAQRDLHLEIPGRWSSTLFPKVYGVGESFLMLLSQIVRLANERDLTMADTGVWERVLTLKEFWVRAKALERAIRVLPVSCSADHDVMFGALRIFFYRRIYDMDASLLQHEVVSVMGHLSQIRQEEAYRNDGNTAALIWPAFLAACEAVDADSQEYFASWFDSCTVLTGLDSAWQAKQIVQMVWELRADGGLVGQGCSWPEVMRAKKMRFTCT